MLQEVELSVQPDRLLANTKQSLQVPFWSAQLCVCVCAGAKQLCANLCLRWMTKWCMCMNMTSRNQDNSSKLFCVPECFFMFVSVCILVRPQTGHSSEVCSALGRDKGIMWGPVSCHRSCLSVHFLWLWQSIFSACWLNSKWQVWSLTGAYTVCFWMLWVNLRACPLAHSEVEYGTRLL